MVGDGFRAVIDEEHERRGKQAEADKSKQKSDHDADCRAGGWLGENEPLPLRAREFNAFGCAARHGVGAAAALRNGDCQRRRLDAAVA
jgi:hypothetical protein